MRAKWITKRIGDVTATQYGLSKPLNGKGKGFKIFRMGEVQGGRLIDTGRMKYADISAEAFAQYKLRRGDVLFNRTNSFELVGKTGMFMLEGDYCFASYLVRLNLDRRLLLPEFLNHLMNSDAFQESIKAKASKSINQANINATILSNELITFPESLPEQKRIVAILDEAFEALDRAANNAKKNLANTRDLLEGYLDSVFTQKGEGWVEKRLKDICEKITDGTHQTPTYHDDGVIFLSSRNVTSGKIDWEKIKYIDAKQHAEMHKRVAPRVNDILLAKNGTTGVAALVDRDVTFDIYVSLALLRPRDMILPKFLWYFVNSPVAKKQFNKRLKGSGVPNLHLEEIREVIVSFPKTLTAQSSIVSELDEISAEVQRLEKVYHQKLTGLAELKQSILQKAFAGKLTGAMDLAA